MLHTFSYIHITLVYGCYLLNMYGSTDQFLVLVTGGCFKNLYVHTKLRAPRILTLYINHAFQYMGKTCTVLHFITQPKIFSNTLKDVFFSRWWNLSAIQLWKSLQAGFQNLSLAYRRWIIGVDCSKTFHRSVFQFPHTHHRETYELKWVTHVMLHNQKLPAWYHKWQLK